MCHIDDYVYDICVDTLNEDSHNFFANGILVHNTDSVSNNSIVKTTMHPDGISIESFYNENIGTRGESTASGHESVSTTDTVLNFNNDKILPVNVKRIIRHKVNKPKYRITTASGKSIECTSDHSLIVFRNGEKIEIKPSEIHDGDKVLVI